MVNLILGSALGSPVLRQVGGGGGVPGWVPEGAIYAADFVNEQYYGGDAPSCDRSSSAYGETSSGLLTTFSANTLRITDIGLTAEPVAATNLVTYSTAVGGTDWTMSGTGSTTLNNATAPDGASTATRRTVTSLGAVKNGVTASLTVGVTYTWSIWAKSANGLAQTWAWWINGAHRNVLVPAAGWTRLSYTAAYSSANALFDFYPNGNAGDAYLWGAQVEAKSSASSLVATTGSAGTRAAEAITLPVTGIGRVVVTYDNDSTQEFTGIDTGTAWAIHSTINRPVIKMIAGYLS